MKYYVIEDYRDAAGIGSAELFEDKLTAIETAIDRFCAMSKTDQRSYQADPAGMYKVYEVELSEEEYGLFKAAEEDVFALEDLPEFTLAERWTADVVDLLHQEYAFVLEASLHFQEGWQEEKVLLLEENDPAEQYRFDLTEEDLDKDYYISLGRDEAAADFADDAILELTVYKVNNGKRCQTPTISLLLGINQ